LIFVKAMGSYYVLLFTVTDCLFVMRITIIDLLFSWPPHGGADVDVFHVARGLRALGHEASLLFVREASCWERGQADPGMLPFPADQISFAENGMTEENVVAQVGERVARYEPDFIVLTQGYFLKVPLILALQRYRVISRCYAHETACHKDILRFKNGAPCPNEYRRTPDICRACALESRRADVLKGGGDAWSREYVATQAWTPAFYDRFIAAMRALYAVVVTTEQMRPQVAGLCDRIHIIPHGVDTARFDPAGMAPQEKPPVILAAGRMEDPAKGMKALLDAAAMLADEGRRFELRATLPEGGAYPVWLKPVGKISHDDMPGLYREADVCVVPSLWDEPFGIVALEAMASALPVCASRVGGLQDIILDKTTGLLFERGNAAALAAALRRLLENGQMRRTMGKAGRARAVEHYGWDALIERHYPSLFTC